MLKITIPKPKLNNRIHMKPRKIITKEERIKEQT